MWQVRFLQHGNMAINCWAQFPLYYLLDEHDYNLDLCPRIPIKCYSQGVQSPDFQLRREAIVQLFPAPISS